MDEFSKAEVSAAELVRGFPQWREHARQEPVLITNHGRQTHVLVGLNLWEELNARVTTSNAQVDSGRDAVLEFADWIDDAVILCDDRLHIVFANRFAHAISRKPANSLVGRALSEALPEIAGSLIDVHIRRTLASGEPGSADIPSPFTPDAWLRTHTFPVGQRNIVVFRDITADVQSHRMADVKAGLMATMAAHGGIGYVRLSLRGTIERAEGCFSEMLGLPTGRLNGVALVDLAARASRPALRAAIEEVLTVGVPSRLSVGFLANDGAAHVFTVAITALKGAYGGEGAICLITPE